MISSRMKVLDLRDEQHISKASLMLMSLQKPLILSSCTVSEELDINMEPPTREGLDRAIALLKRNKDPGIDNITSEISAKDEGETIRTWLLLNC